MFKYVLALVNFLASLVPVYNQVTVDFSANATEGCNFIQVTFTDMSVSTAGTIVSWNWDLGGTNSQSRNPSRIFGSPGFYTICLTVKDDQGNTATNCRDRFIKVYSSPEPSFTLSDSVICRGSTINITDGSSSPNGNIVAWTWDLNGSLGSRIDVNTPPVISNTYNEANIYTLSLTVEDDKGCIANYNLPNGLEVIEVEATEVTAADPLICHLPHRSALNYVLDSEATYIWQFDNGISYIGNNPPDLVVNSHDTVDLLLIASKPGLCRDTLRFNQILVPFHEVNFDVDTQVVCQGQSIVFNDHSLEPTDSIAWIFGDGGEDFANANPEYVYSSSGQFTPILRRKVNGCWIEKALPTPITVLETPEPNYGSSVTLSCFPQNFIFFTDSTPNAVSWDWRFGSNSEFGTADQQNPAVAFNQFGTFPVFLEATLPNGCSASIAKDTITIFEYVVSITPGFSGCVPLDISLMEQTQTLAPTSDWLWNITGDTNLIFSTQQVDFTVINPGAFDVNLLVINELGCIDSINLPSYVVAGTVPNVDFIWDLDTACVDDPILFTDLSDSSINSRKWIFSDMTVSPEINPEKRFDTPGTYDVSLIASYNGCSNSITKSSIVTVLEPRAQFAFDYNCGSGIIEFENQSTGADRVLWDFGVISEMGDTTSEYGPNFLFPQPGNYEVTLTAFNDNGCSHSVIETVRIADPRFSFSASPEEGCKPHVLNIENTSIDVASIEYVHPGGILSGTVGNNSRIQYNQSGVFEAVEVNIMDQNGCLDTVRLSDIIRVDGIDGSYAFDQPQLCSRDTVQFSVGAVSEFGSLEYAQWNFGEGWTSVEGAFLYSDSAKVLPLEVAFRNSGGCVDTIRETIQVGHVEAAFQTDSLGCTFVPTYFISQSIGTDLVHRWTFSDGSFSDTSNPIIQFTIEDTLFSKLYVEDRQGCSDSINQTIEIINPIPRIVADSSSSFCPPFEMTFQNNSANALWYRWNFGDGTAESTFEEPSHIYLSPGVYDVSLTAGHVPGCEVTLSLDSLITVGGPDGFFRNTLDDGSTCAPVPVRFTANFDGIYDLYWDYGDGNVAEIKDAAITFTDIYDYTISGTYVPTLIIEDSMGCQRLFIDDSVVVQQLELDFNLSEETVCTGFEGLQIFNISSSELGLPDFEWTIYNNDTSFIFNALEPRINRIPFGIYSISLVGEIDLCRDSLTREGLLSLSEGPNAEIQYSSVNSCDPQIISFADSSNGNGTPVDSWLWTSTNGDRLSIQPSFQSTFNEGMDTITLLVGTSFGCFDSTTVVIQTLPNVSAQLVDTMYLCSREQALLKAVLLDEENTTTYQWRSDPDLSCTDCLEPSISIVTSKRYYFQAEHSNGCQFQDSVYIELKQDTAPQIQIQAPLSNCSGLPIQLQVKGHRSDYIYHWDSTRVGLNCYENCLNPVATPTTTTVYTVSVENGLGCRYADSVQIDIISPTQNFAGEDQVICMGDNHEFNITNGMDHQWHVTNGLSCSNCADPVARPNTSTSYVVSLIDPNGCLAYDTINIDVIQRSSVEAGNDTSTCLGGEVLLTGQGPGRVIWTSDQAILGNTDLRQIRANPVSSDYYYFTIDTGECILTDSIWVEVTDRVNIEGANIAACEGDTIILEINGVVEQVEWLDNNVISLDSKRGQVIANSARTFTAVGRIGQCIPDTAKINLNITPMPNFRLPERITLFNQPVQLNLHESPGVSYRWMPQDGVSCQDCPNPMIFPVDGLNQYTVLAIDDLSGCTALHHIEVVRLSACSSQLVGVPNAFSPNRDGINDEFKIITSLPDIHLFEVYDRWGNLQFQTSDKSAGWDGTLGGQDKLPGTYVYRLQFVCPDTNENVLITGDITLVR